MLKGTKASYSKSYTLLPLSPPLHIPGLGIHISLRRHLLWKRQSLRTLRGVSMPPIEAKSLGGATIDSRIPRLGIFKSAKSEAQW